MNKDAEDLYCEAMGLHEEGDFQKAFELFQRCAELGDSSAMNVLGTMYTNGEGVLLDYDKAIEWERKAVDHGDDIALLNLGISYRLKGDLRQARHWFERSLATGDGEAAYELARLYRVSDKERDTVRHYLKLAIESTTVCEATREDAQELLSELDR